MHVMERCKSLTTLGHGQRFGYSPTVTQTEHCNDVCECKLLQGLHVGSMSYTSLWELGHCSCAHGSHLIALRHLGSIQNLPREALSDGVVRLSITVRQICQVQSFARDCSKSGFAERTFGLDLSPMLDACEAEAAREATSVLRIATALVLITDNPHL